MSVCLVKFSSLTPNQRVTYAYYYRCTGDHQRSLRIALKLAS